MVTVILAIYAAMTPFFYWKFLTLGAEKAGEEPPNILPKRKKRKKQRAETAESKAFEDYAWNVEHYSGADSVQMMCPPKSRV